MKAYRVYEKWQRHTLPHVTVVPSALAGLTSLFGMGRGGHRRYSHHKILNILRLLGKENIKDSKKRGV